MLKRVRRPFAKPLKLARVASESITDPYRECHVSDKLYDNIS